MTDTFQAAGSISQQLFQNLAGRIGLLANHPGDSILEASDLVITIGYDAVEYEPSICNKGRNRRIIHIYVLNADTDNAYNPAVELIGDIAATLSALTPLISHLSPEFAIRKLLNDIADERKALTVYPRRGTAFRFTPCDWLPSSSRSSRPT